eukprot:CAMPEP_0173411716 /NCGR_PEP_ID=MMETSP1356-20130122/77754_1 /TAXON_ID=77927 ORGANISM="Hemiselmis virescens, Strain PCC157" /NCGR_SAMPLE_ID=MMETSP1356 /ASSEMBLY_ACC=CAM_ASM_000847 /LENGTH=147 /DNA_ID=CAMNT_0014373513 /DNA_START=97 /DNA_END=540 /DNA_ORIENTATION=+
MHAPLKTLGPSSLFPLLSAPSAITRAPGLTSSSKGLLEGVDVMMISHLTSPSTSSTTATSFHFLASIFALNALVVAFVRDHTTSFASGKSFRSIRPVSDPTTPAPKNPIDFTFFGASARAHTHAAAAVRMSVSSPPSARTALSSPVV